MRLQALRPFGYGGKMRLVGEVFERQYLRNDDRLLREDTQFRYMRRLDADEEGRELSHCDQCGRDFIADHFYLAHLHTHAEEREAVAASVTPVTPLEAEFPGGITVDPGGRLRPRRG